MALISLTNATIQYGGPLLLDDVTLHIERGEQGCLVGRNGAGKTTLMRILCGEEKPDSGELLHAPGLRVSYLPQDVPQHLSGTVKEVVASGSKRDHHTAAWEHENLASQVISRLQLEPEADFELLSGGMKRRTLLARALVCEPDVLLLDEPTNHLDIPSIEWLEGFLQRYIETFLFVTHDRMFASRMATRVLDLDRGTLSGWSCGYDMYLKRKAQLVADEASEWTRKEKLLSKEEQWIRKGIKARRTRDEGRVRALETLRDQFSSRRVEQGRTRMQLTDAGRSGDLVVRAEGVDFAYPESAPLIRDLDLIIMRGERFAIIGPNGAGKTTLLRLLCGKLQPTAGKLRLGTKLQLAYFDQLRAALDPEQTVAWNVARDQELLDVGGRSVHVYGYLQDFLFTPERARTPVKVLSGGETNRLLLARLFLEPSNLLVLDEPTNDLDGETLELLEEQVAGYAGTVLMVSHDRAFINHVATGTIAFEADDRLGIYAGGYDDWLQQRAPAEEESANSSGGRRRPRRQRERRLGFKEKHELVALPDRIAALEEEQASLHEELCHPELFKSDPARVAKMQARVVEVEQELEAAVERWAELEELAAESGAADDSGGL